MLYPLSVYSFVFMCLDSIKISLVLLFLVSLLSEPKYFIFIISMKLYCKSAHIISTLERKFFEIFEFSGVQQNVQTLLLLLLLLIITCSSSSSICQTSK